MSLPPPDRLIRMLKSLSERPRVLRYFTTAATAADFGVIETVVEGYLLSMMQAGLVYRKRAVYCISPKGLETLNGKREEQAPAWATAQPYVPPVWHVREGGDDHKRFKSKGVDACRT